MNKHFYTALGLLLLTGCTSLTYQEKSHLRQLNNHGVSIDRPIGGFESPNSAMAAGLLNLLPGFGNFYLASGDGSDSSHYLYGFVNLLLWPISILWAVPEAAIDSNALNKRELVFFYTYNKQGQQALKNANIILDK